MKESHRHRGYRVIISSLAVIGLAIMVYLTYIHYAETRSFCDISETVSCDVVTTSIYSEIFGLPVSLLGLFYFGFVLYLVWFNKKPEVFRLIFLVTLFVLMPSLYLSATELFVIKALCILCETSKLLMIGILMTSGFAARSQQKITGQLAAPVVIAGIVAAVVVYFAQTGTVVKRDYSELVSCLNQAGVVYYKSFRCSNCKRQEKLLGEAYLKLNAVECHPDGPNGQPELCLQKKITKTPTFLIENNGVEVKRAEGLLLIKDLVAFGSCPVPAE